MAVNQVIPNTMLEASRATFVLQVVAFRRADGLRVGPGRSLGKQRGVLVKTAVEGRGFDAGLPPPTSGPTVYMVHVEHLGAAVDHPLFDRVTQIGPGDGGGRVAEGIGAVGLGCVVFHTLVGLELQPVHKGLAAIVHGPATGLVRPGEGVDKAYGSAKFVQVAEPFVADFVVKNRELSEVTAVGVLDNGRPTAAQVPAAQGAKVE